MEYEPIPIDMAMLHSSPLIDLFRWLGYILPAQNAPAAYGIMGVICILIILWNEPTEAR